MLCCARARHNPQPTAPGLPALATRPCRRLKEAAGAAVELTEEVKARWDALPGTEPELQAFIEEKARGGWWLLFMPG